ncbi:MAG: transcription elongation factor GreA [Bacteroides sp.]|nr:transcription elongation factor GreA [Bacteroides sp.]
MERANIMAEKKNMLTYEGLKKLEDELQDLKVNKRQEVAQKIKEAREQGDLSENAEYDAAKDEQRDIESRIEEIEKILKNAEVIDEDEFDHETVNFSSEVVLHDIDMDEVVTYKIVGSTEANIMQGKISNESPLGMALMKRKIGETVTVEAPDGNYDYKILDIKKR